MKAYHANNDFYPGLIFLQIIVFKIWFYLIFQGADTHSLSKVLETVVRLCFETKSWDALNENIVLLTKKRGQIKQVNLF